jgi:short-subunit dehydrogenase
LRLELKPFDVGVVTIAPGYINTEMTAKNPYSMPFLLEAEVFATRAARAIAQENSYTVIPWQMGVVGKIMRALPNWLYDRLAINAPRKPRQKP